MVPLTLIPSEPLTNLLPIPATYVQLAWGLGSRGKSTSARRHNKHSTELKAKTSLWPP